MLITLILISILICPKYVQAQDVGVLSCRGALSDKQREIVRESKALLGDVHGRTLEATLNDMNRTDCPVIQVLILEAEAKTYVDLTREYELKDKKARERLYQKIQMNMAYLQFTAGKTQGDDSSLNRLIRQKLRFYLPSEVLEHPGFYAPVEQ